jgi:hypothetical protein
VQVVVTVVVGVPRHDSCPGWHDGHTIPDFPNPFRRPPPQDTVHQDLRH